MDKGSISEKVRVFFLQIGPRCQSKYGVEFNLADKPIVKRIKRSHESSKSQLEDSGSSLILDLNIKEALETLKLNDSMRCISISPGRNSEESHGNRSARRLSMTGIRSEGASPSSKLFMSPRNSLKPIKPFKLNFKERDSKVRTLPGNLFENNKLPTEYVELDEFIQTEQSILNEVATVTVNLAKPKNQIMLDLSKVEEHKNEEVKLEQSSRADVETEHMTIEKSKQKKAILDRIKKISPIRDSILPPAPDPEHNHDNSEKASSLETMKFLLNNFKQKSTVKRVLKPKSLSVVYKDFSKFIYKKQKTTFSESFILSIIIKT